MTRLSLLVLSFLAPALAGARAEVPDTIAAPGEILIATVHATGVQVYECEFDMAGNLIWHFREPTATIAGVTTIQRINTKGGVAEGACDSHGKLLSVPYSADYAFYAKNKDY